VHKLFESILISPSCILLVRQAVSILLPKLFWTTRFISISLASFLLGKMALDKEKKRYCLNGCLKLKTSLQSLAKELDA
jgi:hypothetical protein